MDNAKDDGSFSIFAPLIKLNSLARLATYVLWVVSPLAITGCASNLYMRGEPDRSMNCDGRTTINGACRFVETVPVQTNANFLTASLKKTREFGGALSGLFFEYTPVGIISPAFGYLAAQEQYEGQIALPLPGTDTPRRRDFNTRAGDEVRFEIDLNDSLQSELARTGIATSFSPSKITFSILCQAQRCDVSTSPNVIADGSLKISAETKSDPVRIAEIEKDKRDAQEALDKQAAAERERAANESAALERRLSSPECKKVTKSWSAAKDLFGLNLMNGQRPGLSDLYLMCKFRDRCVEVCNASNCAENTGDVLRGILSGCEGIKANYVRMMGHD